jgi:hypothetical protein
MNNPDAERLGIRCHAGPKKPDPAHKPGSSSLDFWIPDFSSVSGECFTGTRGREKTYIKCGYACRGAKNVQV